MLQRARTPTTRCCTRREIDPVDVAGETSRCAMEAADEIKVEGTEMMRTAIRNPPEIGGVEAVRTGKGNPPRCREYPSICVDRETEPPGFWTRRI